MLETSARLLRLLSLLQARRDWTGADLADRLGVSARTVRRDVERLRDLGYPVHATRGTDGGYRLGAGAAMPPLLLDDEEAVAVAVGLRTATGGAIAGIEETSVRALAKLEQVLPSRLRRRVNALQTYTVRIPPDSPVPTVEPAVLTVLAACCRDHERLRFDYRDHDGSASVRTVEPHRLVNWGRRWYLVAWDVDRRDWRTFRVDRIAPREPTGPPHGICPTTTSPPTCPAGCRPPRGSGGRGSPSMRRPTSSPSGSTPRSAWSRRLTSTPAYSSPAPTASTSSPCTRACSAWTSRSPSRRSWSSTSPRSPAVMPGRLAPRSGRGRCRTWRRSASSRSRTYRPRCPAERRPSPGPPACRRPGRSPRRGRRPFRPPARPLARSGPDRQAAARTAGTGAAGWRCPRRTARTGPWRQRRTSG